MLSSPKKNMMLDDVDSGLDSGPKNIPSPVTLLDSCLSPNLILAAVHQAAPPHVAELHPKLMLGAVPPTLMLDAVHDQLQNHLPPKMTMCSFLHDVNTPNLMSSNRVLEYPRSQSNALKNARSEMLEHVARYQRNDLEVVEHAGNNDITVRHKFLTEYHRSVRYEFSPSEVLHTSDVLGYCGCKSFKLSTSNTTAAFLQRRQHDSKSASSSKLNFCKHVLAIIVLHFYSDEQLSSFLDDDKDVRGSAAKKLRY